jgi:hypothetical protein
MSNNFKCIDCDNYFFIPNYYYKINAKDGQVEWYDKYDRIKCNKCNSKNIQSLSKQGYGAPFIGKFRGMTSFEKKQVLKKRAAQKAKTDSEILDRKAHNNNKFKGI